MNILIISPNSPYESIGGVERYITNLINYCKVRNERRVVIMLPSYGEKKVEEVGSVTLCFESAIGLSKNSSGAEISKKGRAFSKSIEEIIIKYSIDVICAENFHVGLPPAFNLILNMVSKQHNIPLVLRMHSFASTDLQVELVNQLMWDKISCVSKSVTGDCFQKGADINILSTDYLGVDTNEFNADKVSKGQLKKSLDLSPKSKIILTATRIIHGRRAILAQKGLINLIQAFSQLSPRYPDLYLLIAIGKAPDSLKEEFDQALGMLHGYLKLNNVAAKTIVKEFKLGEMNEVYGGSDLFVLPSENETFGQVFIEAMSSGIAVIGTKVGGIPEIISDSYNGYLVPPNDSSILAQMIEKLLNDPSLKKKFIKAGRTTVESKFKSDKQLYNFMKMLEETITAKRSINEI